MKMKMPKRIPQVIALAACAAAITGCKSIEVERHAQSLATIQNADGTVSVVKDAANNPVVLDGGWEGDYFQHWNWQKFDSLAAKTKEAELSINNYEGGADAEAVGAISGAAPGARVRAVSGAAEEASAAR